MKFKKTSAAVLAAVMAFSSVSAVSVAEDTTEWTDSQGNKWKNPFNVREEESKYEITIENATVNGEEKAAVRLSGLTSKVMDVAYFDEVGKKITYPDSDGYTILRCFLGITAVIDVGERILCFSTEGEDKSFIGAYGTLTPPYPEYGLEDEFGVTDYRRAYITNVSAIINSNFSLFENEIESSFVDIKLDDNGETFDIIAYFDKDNDIIKDLSSAKETKVLTYGNPGYFGSVYSSDGISMGGGHSEFFFEITSEGKIIAIGDFYDSDLNGLYVDEVVEKEPETVDVNYIHKEKVNVTNKMNDTNTSQPTPSTPSTDKPTTDRPSTSEPTESDTPMTEPTEFAPVIDNAENLDEETKKLLSGITVTDNNGAFEEGVVMNVSYIESTDGLFSFNITFTKDGVEVQPNGKVTVKVPVPEALKDGNIYVYHIGDDGKATLISSEVKDGFVIFETDSFSVYALSNELIEDEDTNSDASEPASSTPPTSKPTDNNPSTGIGYAFVPALLAAGAVIASIKNRK